ncbi:MAG: hypothetical protein L0Y56_06175 [Nitrospira sp.]|nr:hypothetical protein [Nitrospira sp.]
MPRIVLLEEVRPRIFHLNFETQYEVCMHLLRWAEFYESPKWAGKNFHLVDFIDWYSKGQGKGVFTYTKDWAGFNIPSGSILELLELGIPDINKYDRFMMEMIRYIRGVAGDTFYLIGTFGESTALEHEIAHGYYYLVREYQEEMYSRYHSVPQDTLTAVQRVMSEMGYAAQVYADEFQAYAAAGFHKKMKGVASEEVRKPFIEIFQRHDKEQEAKLAARAK